MNKTCPGCGLTKSSAEFSPDRWKADGLASCCKSCGAERAKARYERNGGALKREYYAANREEHLARMQAWREANPEYSRADYAMHRARALAVYGDSCEVCGATERLEFDHPDNDGALHRRMEQDQHWFRRVAKTGEPHPDFRIRLLCHDCHKTRSRAFVSVAFELLRVVTALPESERQALLDQLGFEGAWPEVQASA